MTTESVPVAVLGAGNWGTTVAQLAAHAGHHVRLWTRDAAQATEINAAHTNTKFTGHSPLDARIEATTNLANAVKGARLILHIVPSKGFREVSRALGDLVTPDQMLVHGTKGLEQGSHKRMTEILLEETCVRQVGALSGPNIATEILAGQFAGTVIASKFPRVVEEVQRVLVSHRFKVFSNDDVLGVELAGAFKNVVAIAAGMAHQMGLGENMKAMLVTRGISEMAKLGVALGADPLTFFGMAGIGDLVVTCSSPHSRNGRFGQAIARGESIEEAQAKLGMVAEGVVTAKIVHELVAEHRVEAPVLTGVFRVIYDGVSPKDAVKHLMAIPPSSDVSRVLRMTRS